MVARVRLKDDRPTPLAGILSRIKEKRLVPVYCGIRNIGEAKAPFVIACERERKDDLLRRIGTGEKRINFRGGLFESEYSGVISGEIDSKVIDAVGFYDSSQNGEVTHKKPVRYFGRASPDKKVYEGFWIYVSQEVKTESQRFRLASLDSL